MKLIDIGRGYFTKVDDEDYNWLSNYKISLQIGWGGTPYSIIKVDGKNIMMHRFIMETPKGLLVDHINHDTLDNQRRNLRNCTRSQNMWNRKRRCGTSKYKGVHKDSTTSKWCAQIYKYNVAVDRKYFDTELEAALWYNVKAKELFGEFAYLNDIGEVQ